MYFRADDSFDASLVRAFLRRLHSIESWFNAQSSYCFIASSLLFIYDGDAVRLASDGMAKVADGRSLHATCAVVNGGSSGCQATDSSHTATGNTSDEWWDQHVDLKMIDFTHAFPVSSPDENYLTGLRSLVGYMTRLNPGMCEPDL